MATSYVNRFPMHQTPRNVSERGGSLFVDMRTSGTRVLLVDFEEENVKEKIWCVN